MRLWVAGNEAPGPGRDAMIRALQGHGGRVGTLAQRQVQGELAEVWRLGYGPADLVHLLRRAGSPTHAGIVAAAVIDDRDRRGCPSGPATAAWQDQVEGLRRDGTARPALRDTLREALEVWAILLGLPSVPPALPPDGQGHGTPVDTAVLTRVRALLRKAESTEFEAEAEAFVAKAQELITRHAIDLARLPEDTGAPTGADVRRILLDDPYVDAKATLVHVVAEANRARSIYSRQAGWCTVFGSPSDLQATEVLVASLQAQAIGAMQRAGTQRDADGRTRTRSFRNAFLHGFATRIGERLQQAIADELGRTADGAALLPVLASHHDRARDAARAAFPVTVKAPGSISNGAGWYAGLSAADLASLDVSAGAVPAPSPTASR